ncbi:MAG: aminoglycoside phosphotransferase family protein [Gemmatimonadetes bacterium]|nr:aminoglycoside phosphotransferase family protein [Gemmatimonadota bacterium]
MAATATTRTAARIDRRLIRAVIEKVHSEPIHGSPRRLRFRSGPTNEMAEVRFGDGHRLMIKRARHRWAAEWYTASRLSSELLKHRARLVVPTPLELPDDLDSQPLEAYWRIDLPTLAEVWGTLSEEDRCRAMRSWGALLRRAHTVRLPGHGALTKAMHAEVPLSQHLAEDLGGRLMPAVAAGWPKGRPMLEILLGAIPDVQKRAGEEAVLLHGDLHPGNVLCETGEGGPRCVGLLDLETALAGPPEYDLARLEVLGTELLGGSLGPEFLEWLYRGYGSRADPAVLSFFRVLHYLNLGYHAALVGLDAHAAEVAAAAEREAAGLRERLWEPVA